MEDYKLFSIPLFSGIQADKQGPFLAGLDYSVSSFKKGEIVVRAGDLCKHLYLLLSGKVKTEMIDRSGAALRIETIAASRPIASAFLFGENNRFPVNVTVLEDSVIMMVTRDSVMLSLLNNEVFLKNFLQLSASCMLCLTDKLRLLSCKTIRTRLIFYLLERVGSNSSDLILKETQQELADHFGVTRPALAKVLYELVEEGLIMQDRRQIRILDKQALRREIL